MELLWACSAIMATSFAATRMVILATRKYRFGIDPFLKTQGVHRQVTPRLGGIGIFISFSIVCLLLSAFDYKGISREIGAFWLVGAPTFLVGLVEDLTLRVSVRMRLLVTALSASLGMLALGAIIRSVNVPLIDHWVLSCAAFNVAFTLIAVTGIPHALNVVDGCNGLASSAGLCALLAFAAIAAHYGDSFLLAISLSSASAVGGFMIWNFPYGKIFLGDSGSYWLGFTIAELSVLLVARHPQVSAWFPLLLVIYPTWETLFSSFRRVRGGLAAVTRPDVRHLHHLVYRRLMLPNLSGVGSRQRLFANSATTLPFLCWSAIAALTGVSLAELPAALMAECIVFVIVYTRAYRYLAVYRPRRVAHAAFQAVPVLRVAAAGDQSAVVRADLLDAWPAPHSSGGGPGFTPALFVEAQFNHAGSET